MSKTKNRLNPEQYLQQLRAKRDTGLTDWWLKQNGLNPIAVATVDGLVIQAQAKVHELLKQHSDLLSREQLKLINSFNSKLNDSKKRKKLKPSSAYPILNLCSKIYRQAHRNEMIAMQKIQALRNP